MCTTDETARDPKVKKDQINMAWQFLQIAMNITARTPELVFSTRLELETVQPLFFTVEQLRHFAVHTQVSQVMKGHGMLFLTRMFSRGTPGYCLESRGLLGYQIDLGCLGYKLIEIGKTQ